MLGATLQQATDVPSWHAEHFPASFVAGPARPGVLVVESRVVRDVVENLGGRGHVVEVGGDWSEGRLTAASHSDDWLSCRESARQRRNSFESRRRSRRDAASPGSDSIGIRGGRWRAAADPTIRIHH